MCLGADIVKFIDCLEFQTTVIDVDDRLYGSWFGCRVHCLRIFSLYLPTHPSEAYYKFRTKIYDKRRFPMKMGKFTAIPTTVHISTHSGGFRRVQHVRTNRSPQKRCSNSLQARYSVVLWVFLRATACYSGSAYMLSPVRPSVCPSVTWVDQSKTVEVRITQFPPYSSRIPLVFSG